MRKFILVLTINLLIFDYSQCVPAFQRGTAANIPQLMQFAAASGLYQDPSTAALGTSVQASQTQSTQAQTQYSQGQANGNGNGSNNIQSNGTAVNNGSPTGLGAPPVFGMPIPSSFMWAFPFPGQGI
jgi:hypothetical protein